MRAQDDSGFLPPNAAETMAVSRRDRFRLALRTLAERRGLILLTAAAVALVALLVSMSREDRYEANAKLLVTPPDSIFGQVPQDPERTVKTNAELVELESVAEQVREDLTIRGRVLSNSDLREMVEAEANEDSDVLTIHARDSDPQVAATVANEYAEQYVLFRKRASRAATQEAISLARRRFDELTPVQQRGRRGRDLQRRTQDLEIAAAQQSGNVDIVKRAAAPSERVSPRPVLTTLLALPAGLLIGILLAGLISLLDRRIKRDEQVEAITGLPVVGAIPRRTDRLIRRKGQGVWADPVEAEAYGRLATNLRFFNFDRATKTILVTSAVPSEGKTAVTLRLAAALAGAGQGVLAIEADLRKPSFKDYFTIQFPQGLSSVLIGATSIDDVVTRVHTSYALAAPAEEGDEAWTQAPFIEVVPAGVIPPNPQELLSSNVLAPVLKQANDRADIVLVDSAPLVPVGDAVALASAVDGVVLVVQLGLSRRDEVRRALKLLGTLRSKVIGIVITNAERPDARYEHYGQKPAPPQPADPLGPRRRRRPAPRFEERDEPSANGGDSEETKPVRLD